ncbi:MAG TPA: mycofactocin radical SAM maturase [Streptosporangiaceae bacterium]|nr:mycofactocin radical SAM maturase [Streptosporangiaceae bacterium]
MRGDQPRARAQAPAGSAEPAGLPGSAEPAGPAEPAAERAFDLDAAWHLDDRAAVRPEPFGALLYHFGTRKLSFLKSPKLLAVLRGLADHASARAACAAAGVTGAELPHYRRALACLASSGMIVRSARPARPGAAAGPVPPAAVGRLAGGDAGRAGHRPAARLADMFEPGLTSPICLTWELTYACNLACVHCLSSSGRRDPRELTTAEGKAVIDSLRRMQVFYVNIGGGEPTVRPDFWELLEYATASRVGVKFSTNGVRLDAAAARRLAAADYVDVQISLDGATAEVNDAVRGRGSHAMAMRAMASLAAAGFRGFKVSVVVTRHNIGQLDALKKIADDHGAQLRLTRLRPAGRGTDVWPDLHPTAAQQRELYDWLAAHGEQVLTGDSFFHLSPFGGPLPGLNMCGAGRVVCLIDPVGDVYACPFAIHDSFLAGSVRQAGGLEAVWRGSPLFAELRRPRAGGACRSCGSFDSCRGGCMAAKFFTGLPLDGPDPECVHGHGEVALAAAARAGGAAPPRPAADHSRRAVPVTIGRRPPGRACDCGPLPGPASPRVAQRRLER